jgi:hypothetical protein
MLDFLRRITSVFLRFDSEITGFIKGLVGGIDAVDVRGREGRLCFLRLFSTCSEFVHIIGGG